MIKYLIFALCIGVITTAGNVVLKIGAAKESWIPLAWLPTFNGYFILGSILFAVSLLIYMILLKDLPLYVAQSMIAVQYVCGMIVARYGLGEKMSLSDLTGMALILFGILLVAHNASDK